MRKFLLITSVFLLALIGQTYAQDRIVTGKVTATEDGSVLPGVSISVKGTSRGTSTGSDGTFKLSVGNGASLTFSFVGFESKTVAVGSQTVINVSLTSNVSQLSEVVVTALGASREKKSLTYSVQELKSDKITAARDANVGNALAGKIAGVQVLGQSGAKFGSPNIRVRGVNSLTGGDPLYVVDGTPVGSIGDVNMDDVENLSVLKGPSATALYGNRASGGVILITTKRAKSGETSFNINHSTTLDMVGLLPEYQNEYGGGYSQDWDTFAYNPAIHPASWSSFNGQKILDYSADESWGPKMDGTPHRSAFSWQPGAEFGQLTPFSPSPNNVRDFFEKPISNNTNFSFAKGGENFQSRISYTHIQTNGIVPNSQQIKDYVSSKNTYNFSSKFSSTLDITYSATRAKNVPADNYGSSGSTNNPSGAGVALSGYNQTVGSFNQWFQRQLKIEDLRNYKNPDGTYRSWNIGGPLDAKPKYWDSPYTQVYESTNYNNNDRIYGSLGLKYQITDYLAASITSRRDWRSYYGEGRIAYGTLNAGGLGAYSNYATTSVENNNEVLLAFNKTFKKISVLANAGGNIRYSKTNVLLMSTVGGLTTPGFYNIAASKDRPAVGSQLFERQVNSVYGNVSVGYDNFAFIEATLRNDWSSTLPDANNAYLYPSIGGSLVLSELLPKNDIVSFVKLRGSFAKVGTDVGPYATGFTYSTGNAFGSNATQYLPARLPNQQLKPGLSSAYEGGIDFKFFKNKLSVEVTAYHNDNKDQIISLPVASTSGYSSALVNAGLIQTQGFEVHIGGTPVSTLSGFTWESDINFDHSTSKVVELYPGLTNYQLGGPTWRTLTVNAREGEQWGLLVGKGYKLDANGNKLIGADGHYLVEDNKKLGSALPKFKGGFLNTFTYKNLSLRVNIDFIVGGKFFSTTRMFNAYSGLAAETAGLNELGKPKRDPVADGGGILLDGVTVDGKQNTVRVETQELYEDKYFGFNERWIFDQTYVKLRELALGYNIPKTVLGGKVFKSAKLAFIVRNPLLIYSAAGGGIDISEAEVFWTEGGQLPPVRSFGVNLNLGF
ncbi:SusC/RagA family TonB-linked outer membrane protein [Arcicella sp. DC2W]|uniref:SusC/RagA family TonB-linked outer membrane protein n=1 Tax=Arcicella gelida TaxID=2984195 RepID=A0ABU5S446_9BACT|nr:SusC/RagA family TonB-linked outer membrane protein [Arcicella sp. DC2W]MEA5403164.1 SusC/RagA family TonB-linked outer membrane protein [Arcicella sp. DC2W]